MTNQEMQMVLAYLVDRLDPAAKDEVREILGGDLPDLGEDALTRGGFAMDRCPERLYRRAVLQGGQPVAASTPKPQQKAPTFPNMNRLKV